MSTVITEDESTPSPRTPSSMHSLEQPCRCFSIGEIQSATCNFDEQWLIGHGGFGDVFKGTFMDGPTNYFYAIKRLHSMSHQGPPEFWVEVEMLSRLRHCNLVSLIGYCNEGNEMALVYEYMHQGTLSDHLHKKGTPLTWSQRLKICLGAARGLDYLHTGTGTKHGVIHRDVKSSNILLDENYDAKISDFGLAKIGPTNQSHTSVWTNHVKGTFGYFDPNYFYTGILTRKTDVYAFGVVLLEVLCGKPAVDKLLNKALAVWAQERIKQGKLIQILDSSLRDHISRSSLKEFSRIATRCLLSHPDQRPKMSEVITSLDLALSFQTRKDFSAREGIIIKKMWSFLSVKGNFELKRSGSTNTIESNETNDGEYISCFSFPKDAGEEATSEIVSTPVPPVVTEVDINRREPTERQDANEDQGHDILNLEISGDEVISEIVNIPVSTAATEAALENSGSLEGNNANNHRMSLTFDLEISMIKFSVKLLAYQLPRLSIQLS